MTQDTESAIVKRAQCISILALVVPGLCALVLALVRPALLQPHSRWIIAALVILGLGASQFVVGVHPLRFRTSLSNSALGSVVLIAFLVNTRISSDGTNFDWRLAATMIGTAVSGFVLGRFVLLLRRTLKQD